MQRIERRVHRSVETSTLPCVHLGLAEGHHLAVALHQPHDVIAKGDCLCGSIAHWVRSSRRASAAAVKRDAPGRGRCQDRGAVWWKSGGLKMAKYDDIVEGYREKQGDLRRQIAKLRGQIRMGSAEA